MWLVPFATPTVGRIEWEKLSSWLRTTGANRDIHPACGSWACCQLKVVSRGRVTPAIRRSTVRLSFFLALEYKMKRLITSQPVLASLLVCGSIAFAMFTLASSGQLNVATLRSIDGPLDAQQLASIQLCNLLNVAAGSMICGAIFAAIVMVGSRAKNQGSNITA